MTLAWRRVPRPLRTTAGWAVLAVVAWLAFGAVRPYLPVWLRLIVAVAVLVFGPGAGLTARLLAPLPALPRCILGLSFGVAFVPAVAHLLGILGLLDLYPYAAAAATGATLAYWRRRSAAPPNRSFARRLAPVALVLVTVGMGTAAFANRMATADGDIVVYGEYDTYDLTYYAAIAAELGHTVPPNSPFYAGRELNHSFYPHLLLALVHRFGDVPILDLYFRYAWPAFLTLAVLACFVFVEAISTPRAALLAAVLFGAGSDLSYLGRWLFDVSNWDEVIWSHNFQGAGAEVLLYNNWTPALVAMFAGFYAAHAALKEGRAGWIVSAGVAFAVTILSKPWVFACVMAAIPAAMVVSSKDKAIRWRLLLVGAVGLVAAAPLLYRTTTLYEDAQVVFAPAFFPIPLVMVGRLGLDEVFLNWAAVLGIEGAVQTGVAGVLALPVFALGSLGFRLAGLPALWRSLWRPAEQDPIWRVLSWTIVAAFGASTFIVSVPYHETTQIHQFTLFLMAIFAGRTLSIVTHPGRRWIATAAVIAIAVPSTLHYLHRKWTDQSRPFADVIREEQPVVARLRQADPDSTVVLHSRPTRSFLIGILSERRSVASWSSYVRGSDARRDDVEYFFDSAGQPAERALGVLKAYRPTHIVERPQRDRINREVLDQLDFAFSNQEIALYRVPERLRGGS